MRHGVVTVGAERKEFKEARRRYAARLGCALVAAKLAGRTENKQKDKRRSEQTRRNTNKADEQPVGKRGRADERGLSFSAAYWLIANNDVIFG